MTTENQAKAQYTFNQVAAHLIEQNKRSRNNEGRCKYRGTNGLRCAVGFCITNEDYDSRIEGRGLKSCYDSNGMLRVLDKISPDYCNDYNFMRSLQLIHDTIVVSKWPTRLKEFAKTYNLDDSIVDIMVNAKLPVPNLINELTAI